MQTKHILPLTGLRLCAAAWIVVYHFQLQLFTLFPFLSPLLTPFSKLGYQAVPLFFLLSGFILSHNYFPTYSLSQHPRFLFFRFARLWPVHFLTLMLMVAGPELFSLNGDSLKLFAEEILMVRSWFHDELAWNAPAWSIQVEWFAYIFLFPLAFIFFKRIQSWLTLAVLVMLFLAGQACLPSSSFSGRCGSIIFLFLAGSCLYRIRCLVKEPPVEAIIGCGVLLFSCYVLFNQRLSALILFVAFALLIFGLSYERGFLARLLSTKFAVQGGLASYSLYMTHALILRSYVLFFWQQLPDSMLLRFAIFLLTIGALIGTALFVYHFMEEPANRKLRHLSQQTRWMPINKEAKEAAP